MNAPILAASFLLGSLNPKLGLALHSDDIHQTTGGSRPPGAALVSEKDPSKAVPHTAKADPAKKQNYEAVNQRGKSGKPTCNRGGTQKVAKRSPIAKSASTPRSSANGGGLSRKTRRLDPDRQGFSALIPASSKLMTVRVTVYWKDGKGTDSYTSRGISSTGNRLVNKKSAAVDPNLIPYGSKIILPEVGKELVAVDTGTAVVRRTAAKKLGKDVPVIDIFFDCKKEALDFASNNPLFMKAVVVN